MPETEIPQTSDVFAAARWLDDVWNSSARAISPGEIEWMCRTWGSGRGRCYWTDTAVFNVVTERFGLRTDSNWDGRDELIVYVPLANFSEIADLIGRLSEDEPESWPWFDEDNEDRQIPVAAAFLGISEAELQGNTDLLETLRIE